MNLEVLEPRLGESMRVRLSDGRLANVMPMTYGKSRINILDEDGQFFLDNW